MNALLKDVAAAVVVEVGAVLNSQVVAEEEAGAIYVSIWIINEEKTKVLETIPIIAWYIFSHTIMHQIYIPSWRHH